MKAILLAASALVVACTTPDAPLLPCGSSGYADGATSPTDHFTYDWDTSGHLLHEVETSTAGATETTIDAAWDGDNAIRYDYASPSRTYHESGVVEHGELASYRHDEQSGTYDLSWNATYTWSGRDLAVAHFHYADPTFPDQTETYTPTGDGYTFQVCSATGDGCDTARVVGADYVGDLEHFTLYEYDQLSDGVVDERATATYDPNGYELTYDDSWLDNGAFAVYYHEEYTRDADGQERSLSSSNAIDNQTYRIDYTYDCGTAARAIAPPRRPPPLTAARH